MRAINGRLKDKVSMESQQQADFLIAPDIDYSLTKVQHFESLFQAALNQGECSLIPTTAPYPIYEFLCYLVHHKGCLLHGSHQPAITRFEPRQQTD